MYQLQSIKVPNIQVIMWIAIEDNEQQILVSRNVTRNPSLFVHETVDNNDLIRKHLVVKTSHIAAMVTYQEKWRIEKETNLGKPMQRD